MSNEFKSMKEFLVYISKGGKFKPKWWWTEESFLVITDNGFFDQRGDAHSLSDLHRFQVYEKYIEPIEVDINSK